MLFVMIRLLIKEMRIASERSVEYSNYKGETMKSLFLRFALALFAASLSVAGAVSNAAPGSGKAYGHRAPGMDDQMVVISIKTDPTVDPEPACVAIQIGINLLKDNATDLAQNVYQVEPAEVTLFITTGGAELIDPRNFEEGAALDGNLCFAPGEGGLVKVPLTGLLNTYESLDGEIVICPLCAFSRGIGTEEMVELGMAEVTPTRGYIGGGVDIHNLFMDADKVIDF